MLSTKRYVGIHLTDEEKERAATILKWMLAESDSDEYVSPKGYRFIRYKRRANKEEAA